MSHHPGTQDVINSMTSITSQRWFAAMPSLRQASTSC